VGVAGPGHQRLIQARRWTQRRGIGSCASMIPLKDSIRLTRVVITIAVVVANVVAYALAAVLGGHPGRPTRTLPSGSTAAGVPPPRAARRATTHPRGGLSALAMERGALRWRSGLGRARPALSHHSTAELGMRVESSPSTRAAASGIMWGLVWFRALATLVLVGSTVSICGCSASTRAKSPPSNGPGAADYYVGCLPSGLAVTGGEIESLAVQGSTCSDAERVTMDVLQDLSTGRDDTSDLPWRVDTWRCASYGNQLTCTRGRETVYAQFGLS